MPTQTCLACRHWKLPPESEAGRTGICRKPVLSSGFAGWAKTLASDHCEDWAEMTYFHADDGTIQVDRRNAVRTQVDFPARLQTTGGDWSGRLSDFSETGARLVLSNPPKAGTQALLKCGSDEIFCKVAWSLDNSCGLAFDWPVPRTLVVEIAGQDQELPPLAVADPRRIPEGKKRMRLSRSNLVQTGIEGPMAEQALDALQTEANVPEHLFDRIDATGTDGQGPVPASFESRDDSGYIKFYPFRAMANP